MTRLELIRIVVGQARSNGFEFRRWFTTRLALPWQGADAALALLESHRRYYALLFSHDFAEAFWKPGAPMTFQVAPKSYERRMPDGSIRTIKAAAYKRRSARPDAWRYHLREMALADEPLRYMRRYLHVEGDLSDEFEDTIELSAAAHSKPVPADTPELVSPTLALARKAHERRELAKKTSPPSATTPRTARRGARPPGSRKKTAKRK